MRGITVPQPVQWYGFIDTRFTYSAYQYSLNIFCIASALRV